jgi:hypothetical protein
VNRSSLGHSGLFLVDLADPVSCEPIDSFDPAESTSTSDNDEDETAIFEPHQSEDEEARILSLIEQCLNTKGKADFDVDLDNELEQAVLPLINEFASRKKIPYGSSVMLMTNAPFSLTFTSSTLIPKQCAQQCSQGVSLGRKLGLTALNLHSAVKPVVLSILRKSLTPRCHR